MEALAGDEEIVLASSQKEQSTTGWTSDEDKALLRLLHDHRFPTWLSIAQQFENTRTIIACQERHIFLQHSQPESLPKYDVLYWTEHEDRYLLLFSRDDSLTTWNLVADQFIDPLKTAQICCDRYKFVEEKVVRNAEFYINNKKNIAQLKNGFLFIYILFYLFN
jgi:hypothetical protein